MTKAVKALAMDLGEIVIAKDGFAVTPKFVASYHGLRDYLVKECNAHFINGCYVVGAPSKKLYGMLCDILDVYAPAALVV